MKRMAPSVLLSLLLHGGLILLVLFGSHNPGKPIVISSVPVELVSTIPEQSQAAAPKDENAVLAPEPEPAPPEPLPPEPKPDPIPAPKQPVEAVKKDTRPDPPKPAPKPVTPPSKDGLKKPDTNALDLEALAKTKSAPPKSNTRTPARPSPNPTDGASSRGTAAADTGVALNALIGRLQRMWSPNCDVPGADQVKPEIAFTISPSGRVIKGPEWLNKTADPVWVAAANRAIAAVKRGELYEGLPDGLYNQPLEITFNGQTACKGNKTIIGP
jgi:periplasmic protein TonB